MRISVSSICCLLALTLSTAQAQTVYDQFYQAIRGGNLAQVQTLLESGQSPNVTGPQKMTPLLDATVIGSAEAVQLLLDHGAEVEAANAAGNTALVLATGNPEKTRLLRQHGAVAKSLDPGLSLMRAAALGDTEMLTRLIAEGVDVNPVPPSNSAFTPLMTAAVNRRMSAVKLLLANGARVNAATPVDKAPRVKHGPIDRGGQTALHVVAPYGPIEMVKVLLEAGADVNAKDIQGMTPLMMAVASDYQDPEIVRMLLARGADRTIKSRDGLTALDYARRLGAADGIHLLGGKVDKLPAVAVKTTGTPDPKTAVERGMEVLRLFSDASFRGGCIACHAQPATMAAGVAAKTVVHRDSLELASRYKAIQATIEQQGLQRANGEAFLYILESLDTGSVSQRATDYAVAGLAATQDDDGTWSGSIPRAPIQDGAFMQTAFSVRMLARYAPPSMKAEVTAKLAKSRTWLLNAKPVTTEASVMRMLGLVATDANAKDVESAAQVLIALQRADGGWGQREEIVSDAYATGMALWALADAGRLKPSDAVYQRGVRFLTGTQAADGSWFVKSRAVVRVQPYFDSGFPYEHDQWISSMATSWAVKALAIAAD